MDDGKVTITIEIDAELLYSVLTTRPDEVAGTKA